MSGRNDVTRSGTCGTTCILDDVHYSICSLRARPARTGWRWERLRRRAIAALYRALVYTSTENHALFMNGSPKIRRQRGTTRVRERKVVRWGGGGGEG